MTKEILQRFINQITENIAKLKEKVDSDFNYQFEWGVLHQIYQQNHKLTILQTFQKQWNETDETDEVFFARFKAQLLGELLNTSPLDNSTNGASNEAKRLRIEATRDLLANYGVFNPL